MPDLIRAVVKLNVDSAIEADKPQNVFHFGLPNGDPSTAAQRGDIANCIDAFYEAIDHLLSKHVEQVSHTISFYDLEVGAFGESDDISGSPREVVPFSTSALPAGALPSEVAVCLSFHGPLTGVFEEFGATRPRARRRGRVYLGPLDAAVMDSNGYVSAQARLDIAAAADALMDQPSISDTPWVVYSRAEGSWYPVVGGHVDNAFDIQRRRGLKSTARTTFGATV